MGTQHQAADLFQVPAQCLERSSGMAQMQLHCSVLPAPVLPLPALSDLCQAASQCQEMVALQVHMMLSWGHPAPN